MSSLDEDQVFWDGNVARAAAIEAAISKDVTEASPVTDAVNPLQDRVRRGLRSLRVLHQYSDHDTSSDGMAIVRTMYEAHLQVLYIVHDPTTALDLAQLFLDYRWIEQHRLQALIDSNETGMARRLRASPKRSVGEAERRANFERLRPNYLNKSGKLRTDWYVGKLDALAAQVGCRDEFLFLQRDLSGAVHSMPSHLLVGGAFGKPQHLLLIGWALRFRVLGAIASHFNVPLGDEEAALVERYGRCLFEVPPSFK